MNSLDHFYFDLLNRIHSHGTWEPNRTGIDAKTLVGATLEHDMADGFPLLCHKRVAFKPIRVELEAFIRGIRSKAWLQERGCTIWDEWCNPKKVTYSNSDPDLQAKMRAEDDLGRIYGVQWRDFRGLNDSIDQLANIAKRLRTNPDCRRMICSAWNPAELGEMALPPCHVLWQVTVVNGKLNLLWFQRSVDVPLGLPFNIASYGLLLQLLSAHSGIPAGKLTGFLSNVHYYRNQQDGVDEVLRRGYEGEVPSTLPTVEFSTPDSVEILDDRRYAFSIFDWEAGHTMLKDYKPHPDKIDFPIAV